MRYKRETEMYPEVIDWLHGFLAGKFPRAQLDVRDTHTMPLNHFIELNQLSHYFDNQIWRTYEIQVDITGFVIYRARKEIVFVECKINPISLKDFSQILGYSRIAHPVLSFLISPAGITGTLNTLLIGYGRTDILEYHFPRGGPTRKVILAKWDPKIKQLEIGSIIPPGTMT